MAKKDASNKTRNSEEKTDAAKRTCFVIMPISDVETYSPGHFRRVYEYIIKPACEEAGFEPKRADDVVATNHIIIDVLKRIIEADITICDLSSRNPNVLYELGIRQAFNLPVTLIKDTRTPRIFDIQGLRDVEYDETLRVDKIEAAVPQIAEALTSTYESETGSVNSIIQLLGIEPAKVSSVEVSQDTGLLLDAINSLGERISRLERTSSSVRASGKIVTREIQIPKEFVLKDGTILKVDSLVKHPKFGKGKVTRISHDYIFVQFNMGASASFPLGSDSPNTMLQELKLINEDVEE